MSDAKVAYDYDDRGKVRRQSRFGQNLPQTGLSVFSPKNLPLPATRLKSIQQREQATDGKLKGIKERFTDEAGYYASSVSRSFSFCCKPIAAAIQGRWQTSLLQENQVASVDRRSGSRHSTSTQCPTLDRVIFRFAFIFSVECPLKCSVKNSPIYL